MDILEIMGYLPHRYPMLLIDRVTEFIRKIDSRPQERHDERAVFPGHFPSYPVMPAVLVIEALAQLASILAVANGRPQAGRRDDHLLRRHRRRAAI